MFHFDSDAQKSFGELCTDIDHAILLHCWAQTDVCPECGCDAELVFAPETPTAERYVEVRGCDTCDAILQAVVGDIDPSECP